MNQVVLISGAAGGIGAATARLLAERGAHVVLADLDSTALESLAAGIPASSTAVLDVTDPAACAAVVRRVVETHGRLDVVWANAGISAYGPAELLDPDAWRRVVEVNLVGAYNLVNAALPAVIEAKGYVALTASWASFAHSPGHTSYAATKAGLEAFGNALRTEVAHQGVGVGVFHPGWTATPLVNHKLADHPAFNALLESLPGPLARVTPVDELAEVLADAIEQRRSRVIHPRAGWFLHLLRPILPTPLFSASGRKVAPTVRALYREHPR